jgi:hypothetical protein
MAQMRASHLLLLQDFKVLNAALANFELVAKMRYNKRIET